ncbi:MAG: sigma-70 family RNA polymerase sigma factor [Elusimicrobia bacterium]|nr:sigma-70 family RNA polymerase sigma factor [Candidatus Obscuribacterium magneticum]
MVDKEQLFSDLIRQCGDYAYNFAYRLCGNESDANDLVQGAFMKALENIDNYDPSKPFQPWLNRILHNLYVDNMKRYEKRKSVSLDAETPAEDESWSNVLPENKPGPIENLSSQELDETVQSALDRLDGDYRTAIILSDIEGKSYEEISQIMGCPIGTVRSRIHRGRTLLRKILEPFVGEKEMNKP